MTTSWWSNALYFSVINYVGLDVDSLYYVLDYSTHLEWINLYRYARFCLFYWKMTKNQFNSIGMNFLPNLLCCFLSPKEQEDTLLFLFLNKVSFIFVCREFYKDFMDS